MNRSRITGDLVSQNNIFVDIANDRVGIGSTIPGTKLQLPDDEILSLGNSADLKLVHTTSLSSISSGGVNNFTIRQSAGSGFLFIHGDQLHLRSQSTNEPYLTGVNNGAVTLYYDNSVKFETRAGGATVSGTINATGGAFTGNLTFANNVGVLFGSGNPFQIYHNSGTSVIEHHGTGQIHIKPKATEHGIKIFPDGAVELYHNNNRKIFTTSTGVQISCDPDGDGLKFEGTTNRIDLVANSNRSGAINTILELDAHWNNTSVAFIALATGDDTTNKDDGRIRFFTKPSGGTIAERLKIDPDGKSTFTGDVTVGSGGENSALGVRVNSAYAQIKLPDGQTGADRKGNLSFGDSDDFRIVHDGYHNYITAGVGDIYISHGSANPVNIYNNRVNVNVDLNLIDTDAGSAAGPELKLYRNSASPADADHLGQIKFAGESDTGVERNYAKITGKILDASNGTEDGIIEFAHIKAGSQTITGRFRSDSLQLLNDTNFSVAGTSELNVLTFGDSSDGSTNNIAKFGASGDLVIYHNGNHSKIIDVGTGNLYLESDVGSIYLRVSDNEQGVTIHQDGAVEVYHDNSKKLETSSTGVTITGRLNMTEGIDIPDGGDNNTSLSIGSGNDLRLYHDGSHSYIKDRGTGNLYIQSNHVNIDTDHGEQMINCIKDGAVELYHDNAKKFETYSGGAKVHHTSFTTLEVRAETNDAVLRLTSQNNDDNDWTVQNDYSESYRLDFRHNNNRKAYLDSSGNLFIAGNLDIEDNDKLLLGGGDDLQIYHDGSHSNIINTTGQLKVRGVAGEAITFRNGDDTANVAVFNVDDATHLYHDSAHKFSTTSTGIKVVGNCLPNSNDSGQLGTSSVRWQELNITDVIDVSDNGKIRMGNSDDLQLYHDGSNSFVQHVGTGGLYIDALNNSADITLRSQDNINLVVNATSENAIACVGNGGVLLYHQGNQKFETTSSGISVSGNVVASGNMQVNDSNYLYVGNGGDLRLSHNGSHSFINNQTGDLSIQSDGNLKLERKDGGEDYIHCIADGAVELHHNGDRRLETTSTGAKITGVNGSNPTLQIEHSNVDTEGEFIRVERKVSPTIRYHSIKARHSGSINNNHIAFHIHDPGTNTTSQVEALKILGSGNLTYSQQAMTVLVNPTDESTINESDNDDPIHFESTYVNKGGMSVSQSTSRITVPLSGTYLLTGCVSGSVTNESQGDGIQLSAMKNGSNTWYDGTSSVFPIETFGTEDGMEYAFTFAIPTVASANDYFEVSFFNLGGAVGNISRGYFSVTKLH